MKNKKVKRTNIVGKVFFIVLAWGILFWANIFCLFIKKIQIYPRIVIIVAFLILTVYGIYIIKKINKDESQKEWNVNKNTKKVNPKGWFFLSFNIKSIKTKGGNKW